MILDVQYQYSKNIPHQYFSMLITMITEPVNDHSYF